MKVEESALRSLHPPLPLFGWFCTVCVAPRRKRTGVLGRVNASLALLAAGVVLTRPAHAHSGRLAERHPGRKG